VKISSQIEGENLSEKFSAEIEFCSIGPFFFFFDLFFLVVEDFKGRVLSELGANVENIFAEKIGDFASH
jgi:hypothetical protein